MGIKIGSFNMFKFSAYTSNDEIKKDLNKISNIISDEQFDIIALQEIFSQRSMDMLLQRLGSSWKGYWASPNARTSQAAEGFAFLWNTRKVDLVKSISQDGQEKTYMPRIYNQYKVDRKNGHFGLLRNPLYARFKPKYGFFEIRLINVHIIYSANVNLEQKDNEIMYGDIAKRKKEFELLSKSILLKESEKRYGNNMPSYTIMLGDYNLNLKRDWTKGAFIEDAFEIYEDGEIKRIMTIQDQLTTLKAKNKNNEKEYKGGFANNFDHFSYLEKHFKNSSIITSPIDSVNKYSDNDFDKHRKEISDHIPVYMEINLK